MVGSSLPPGFRFHPTDEELVGYYLQRRNKGLEIELEVIPLIDLYNFDPWELPDKSFLPNRDMEWFFFCPRDRKYPNGSRANRATRSGYWKATGKDRKVICLSSTSSSTTSPMIGYRKTLVFYLGRAPLGSRTEWIMHEYRLCDDPSQGLQNFKGALALCRVVKKNEQTQKIGESSSAAVANEPLNVSDEVSCRASHPQIEISGTRSPVPSVMSESGSSRIWVSPDFILESASKGYTEGEESASEQIHQHEDLQSSTWLEYPELFIDPSYSNFDWEMKSSSDISPNTGFEDHQECYMNMDMDIIMSYDNLDHFDWTNNLNYYS